MHCQSPHRWTSLIARLVTVICIADAAHAASYTFTKIVDNAGGTIRDIGYSPSINNTGAVVFRGNIHSGPVGIFVGNGGPIMTIADSDEQFSDFGNECSINDHGTVAFRATLGAGGAGVFLGNGETTSVVADDSGSFRGFSQPIINNFGVVAFTAELDGGGSGLFAASGGVITEVYNDAGPFAYFSPPCISDSGQLAFLAGLDSGAIGVFKGSGAGTTTIADTSGSLAWFQPLPSINANGTVAFFGGNDAGGWGIFTGDGGPVTLIADNSGQMLGFGPPSINNEGRVAWLGSLNTGELGIYTGPDPVSDKVIQTGDFLDGSIVDDLDFNHPRGMNDRGQLAFRAIFEDGRIGIYRADPVLPLTFIGFLAPISGADQTGGSFSAPKCDFKMGSTIPVKFRITKGSESVMTGRHSLQITKYRDELTTVTTLAGVWQGQPTKGNEFRLAEGHWQFNLDTRATGMSVGIWLLTAHLSDGSKHSVWIQIK
jgi:hypothetical protein